MTTPQEKAQCVSWFIEQNQMFRPSETTEVSMEETLCTVERGSSNCLAAVRMDFIGER